MFIVDTALAKREDEGDPVRVAIVGAGPMARCIAPQIVDATTGIEMCAISHRRIAKADDCYEGADAPIRESSQVAFDAAIERPQSVVTDYPWLIWNKLNLEATIVCDATGFVPAGRGMQDREVLQVNDLATKFDRDDHINDEMESHFSKVLAS